ncbi:MAG: YqgE/AlgH family protein [Paramuribaculum sp.]|nr:YqgE/AlgH family protein [Paramuribaculum sp.]MDE6323649.1 YqgE/AlgH family protein [Paramuribaculum sp.]MDE6487934.1 YqgE/AlgH family protein [Paramuribaculum sp.]
MNEIEKLIFNIDIPSDKPASGKILVSEPFLREEYFRHAVVALFDHSDGGSSMGAVLNRQTTIALQNLLPDIETENPIPVFCGGPMSCDRLFFIHALGDIISDSKQLTESLWIGGDFGQITEYVNAGYPLEGYVRFILGYSGWSAGQLEEEIDNRVWAVTSPDSPARILTGSDDSYWHHYVRRLGNRYRGWRFHPANPSAN